MLCIFQKEIAAKFFLILLTLIPLGIKGQELTKAETFPAVEVVRNKINSGGESGIKSRYLYLLIGEKDFSLDNIQRIFKKYKKIYDHPYNLHINLYSDKEMLQRMIKFNSQRVFIEFADNEKGRAAAQEFYEKYYPLPLPTGYFRAEYSRYGSFEYFNYSPAKEKAEMVRISLKK